MLATGEDSPIRAEVMADDWIVPSDLSTVAPPGPWRPNPGTALLDVPGPRCWVAEEPRPFTPLRTKHRCPPALPCCHPQRGSKVPGLRAVAVAHQLMSQLRTALGEVLGGWEGKLVGGSNGLGRCPRPGRSTYPEFAPDLIAAAPACLRGPHRVGGCFSDAAFTPDDRSSRMGK